MNKKLSKSQESQEAIIGPTGGLSVQAFFFLAAMVMHHAISKIPFINSHSQRALALP
jgi:hypothetical protein